MVEKLKHIVEKIQKEKGEVGLLALLKLDSYSESSVIIFSADWVDPGEKKP